MTNSADNCVYIVDDDRSVLRALSRLLASAGYEVRAFESPAAFLREHDPEIAGCAILDVGMSELDGLSVQERLGNQNSPRPIIFLSGHDDAVTCARAMKAGAADYLTKPVSDSVVLDAVEHAIEADTEARRHRQVRQNLEKLFARLTPREKSVFRLVVQGYLNKQIAFELGIVEKTVKVHRGRVMQKLHVRSFAQLLWAAERLGLADGNQPH
jgi:RNA polymerase sigma factor (sigma-70 family)